MGEATGSLMSARAVADALVKNVLENRRAGNDRLMLAAAWADMHQVPPGVKDGEHPGAEGTPEVARFAVEELNRSGVDAASFPVRKDAAMPKKFDPATKERARRMIAEQAAEVGSVTK
ncbi:MAG TPA: hypothetical protein VFK52_01195, partial [Nocardioidaceae bacterium]|nr:hypothetical protein [Nocardioidaceae bacterium]